MNIEGLRDELSDLLASVSHSLAQHLEEAHPFLCERTYRVWMDIRHLQEANHHHERRLAGLLQRLRLEPRPRPYSPNLARYHDLDLAVLVRLLLTEKRQQAQAFERAIPHAAGNPAISEELTELLGEVRQHIQTLESSVACLDDAARRAG